MATVYLAHDPKVKRDVAVKILPREYTHDQTFRARFEREAQEMAALEHEAIVPVYDYGEQDNQPYLVMRHMSGNSLADRLLQGALTLPEAVQNTQRLAAALDHAHRNGIVHRDLKPSNILFDDYGKAYLADFGIARLSQATTDLTGSAIIGTPAYMSPEQIRGEAASASSDIYALAIVLYEMLTGSQPYRADTPIGVAYQHVHAPIPLLVPELPTGMQAVLARGMAKTPHERYQTATDLSQELLLAVPSLKQQPKAATQAATPLPRVTSTPIEKSPTMDTGSTAVITRGAGGEQIDASLWDRLRTAALTRRLRALPRGVWIALLLLLCTGSMLIATFWPDPSQPENGVGLTTIGPIATEIPPTLTPTPSPTRQAATSTSASLAVQDGSSTSTPTVQIIFTNTPEPTPTPAPYALVITFESVNLRDGPGTVYGTVGILYRDDTVVVLARDTRDTWYNVVTEDGVLGWIAKSVTTPLDAAQTAVIPLAATIPAPPTATHTPIVRPTATPSATPPPPPTRTPPPTATPTQPPTPTWTPTPCSYPYC